MDHRPVYLDCNATAPLHPAARETMLPWLQGDLLGNPGSRTHAYGNEAQKAVNRAREQLGTVAGLSLANVVFTSGATEASNLSLLGLAAYGERERRRHIVTTAIEHKATLEPLSKLASRGFEVTLVQPDMVGRVNPAEVLAAVRDDTLLVSMMHVNNETGMVQPVIEVAEGLRDRPTYLHIDASQGFCKDLPPLRHERVDLISVSGHKFGGPMGVGALLIRKRQFRLPPVEPITFGGGQERGLRPGTVPPMLVVGMGAAVAAMLQTRDAWWSACTTYRDGLLKGLVEAAPDGFDLNMDPACALPNCLNLSLRSGDGGWLDSEAVLLSLKDVLAASNGSACTSAGIEPSHVLIAQGLPSQRVRAAIRLSWCDTTPRIDWERAKVALSRLV